MLSITLQPQDEYRWEGKNPSPDTFPVEEGKYPLYHQWRTYNSDASIIVNTHNTGTGKTKAALLRLLKRAQKKGIERITPTNGDALLIAPTNELIQQHTLDAQIFCNENDLPYRVLPITHEDLLKYRAQPGFSEGTLRLGAAFHSILNNPSHIDGDTEKRATLFIVNPDIFYYAIYFCYNVFDKGALANDFMRRFNYIIVDEFHYYTPKQFMAFLFFMKYSQAQGYIDSKTKQRQFCILTATPRPQVEAYLNNLGVAIEWIKPGEVLPGDEQFLEPVRALTGVQLTVYSTDELKEAEQLGGLVKLVEKQREQIQQWLNEESLLDGAIISSSLGAINTIHKALLPSIPDEMIGRVTGAQWREDRQRGKEKRLILATPTVDIGYNFERPIPKPRQNIDFLLFDASSGDDFIQRLGRAGRVLAKEEKDHDSMVMAVVDPDSYKLLTDLDGTTVDRTKLSSIALEMPRKNDLYAYLRSGSIIELFHPLLSLQQGLADETYLDTFLHEFQQVFLEEGTVKLKSLQDGVIKKLIRDFDSGNTYYSRLQVIPQEAFELLPMLLDTRIRQEKVTTKKPHLELCLDQFGKRLKDAWQKQIPASAKTTPQTVIEWLQKDIRSYYKEKARFSFREGFQPPLALIYDADKLHSDQEVNVYDALHIVRYYQADFYATYEEWKEQTGRSAAYMDTDNVSAYCRLKKFREEPLRLSLALNAGAYTQDAWEAEFAYQVTSLYGLKLVAVHDQRGIDTAVQSLFSARFVPAFVAVDSAQSTTGSIIRGLRKKARFYPLRLNITFAHGIEVPYHAILGSMAFQICAEIPYWAIARDRGVTQRADEEPLIF